mgnify:CR=1 FL=1
MSNKVYDDQSEEAGKRKWIQKKIDLAMEERNQQIAEDPYYKDHAICPECKTANYKTTLVAYISPVKKDSNKVECSCGWKGKVDDLVPDLTPDEKVARNHQKQKETLEAHGLELTRSKDLEGALFAEITQSDLNDDLIDATRQVLRFLADIGGSVATLPQLTDRKVQGFVCWDRFNDPWVGFNPKYYTGEKKKRLSKMEKLAERCISYLGETFLVPRYKQIQATWWKPGIDDDGNYTLEKVTKALTGLDAQYFQYAADYCHGRTLNTQGERLPRPDEVALLEETIKQKLTTADQEPDPNENFKLN